MQGLFVILLYILSLLFHQQAFELLGWPRNDETVAACYEFCRENGIHFPLFSAETFFISILEIHLFVCLSMIGAKKGVRLSKLLEWCKSDQFNSAVEEIRTRESRRGISSGAIQGGGTFFG